MKLNGTAYRYELNNQGDVIGLVDSENNEVVSYTYDAWGKVLTTGGSLASTVGAKNPLRYRGYYYDTETGLYYLQSRYYNPEWGRFISKDEPGYHDGTSGAEANLYTYCRNNPVNAADSSGHYALAIVGIYFIPGFGEVALTATAIILTGIAIWLVSRLIINWIQRYGRAQLAQVKRNIPSKLKTKDGRVDLRKFNNRNGKKQPKGGRSILGPLGYQIVKDLDRHKGGVWKLLDRIGRRIATLSSNGTIIGK